jgi:hypothetical protein
LPQIMKTSLKACLLQHQRHPHHLDASFDKYLKHYC